MSVLELVGGEWLSVADVAASCHVSERTVRRWVAEEVVRSRVSREGLRESRLILRESLPRESGDDTLIHDVAPEDGTPQQDAACHVVEDPGLKFDTHVLSEITTLTERAIRAESEAAFLREQLTHHSHLLARLERTNAELAGALVQKALPPAVEPRSSTRRVRWWSWWKR